MIASEQATQAEKWRKSAEELKSLMLSRSRNPSDDDDDAHPSKRIHHLVRTAHSTPLLIRKLILNRKKRADLVKETVCAASSMAASLRGGHGL